jgi:hypothetical protein
MSKPLTLRNREDKGDVDPGLREDPLRAATTVFPSYFSNFSNFFRFLALSLHTAFTKRRLGREHEITPAAAIMAIV